MKPLVLKTVSMILSVTIAFCVDTDYISLSDQKAACSLGFGVDLRNLVLICLTLCVSVFAC